MSENWSDDEFSSENGSYYSDWIDSDIEAELYSSIHHDVTDNSISYQENIDTSKGNLGLSQENSILSRENPVSSQITSVHPKSSQKQGFQKTHNNKPIKRKSDVVSEILENIQVTCESDSRSISFGIISSEPKIDNHMHLIKQSNADSLVEDETVSSDSDSSVIFFEPDESEPLTNLKHKTIILSSGDDESDSSTERMFAKSCQVKGKSLPNNLSSNEKDLWHVNIDDKYRSRKSYRYHERAVLTCSNCNMKGHNARFCQVPKMIKCFICGGNHSGNHCRDKMCSKCTKRGHDGKRCYAGVIDSCFLCNMKGHVTKNCPDLWRRYHLTTSFGKIVEGEQYISNASYCYNCGLLGHYGAECTMTRMDNSTFPTWTSVISYNNPRAIYRNEGKKGFSKENAHDRNINLKVIKSKQQTRSAQVTPSQQRKKKKKNGSVILPNLKVKNKVKNEVYFPRTPKATTSSSVNKEDSATNISHLIPPREIINWKRAFKKQQRLQKKAKLKMLRRLSFRDQ
ncbi:uncharacterized protein NPIL_200431 [Nephila pilipes]|uniref:Zinc finger CCHC domain-containing protein 7 n=1 Tax=Nephila pilipes TaxID=299642 RepID=A0A8X6Q7D5_NEPPI|nr:uncharacterized protein NPIL_200431 [Nephila pilipes]